LLVRYRGAPSKKVKEHQFKGKIHIFTTEEWTSIEDLSLFFELEKYPSVYDIVRFFDVEVLKPYQKSIKVVKDLIFTSDKTIVRNLEKISFLKLQSYNHTKKQYVFKILNYGNSNLSNYKEILKRLNILVYRRKGGLGDIIMTTPVLEKIKEKYPGSKITYSCPSDYVLLMKNNPFVDYVKSWDKSVMADEYDVVIDLTRDCIQYEIENQPNVKFNRTEVFLSSCGLSDGEIPIPKIFLSEQEIQEADEFVSKFQGMKIGLVLESNAPIRRWHYFQELREKILKEYPNSYIFEISVSRPKGWTGGDRVIPVFGRDLRSLSAIINKMDLVISPDTGPAHIASALKVPTIWIFTHIDGMIRTRGYSEAVVLQDVTEKCPRKKPCWYEVPCDFIAPGEKRIREELRDPFCGKSISSDRVMKEIKTILSRPFLSYIVVYHNIEDVTEECLRRILSYKKYNDEIILIDNGSEKKNYFQTDLEKKLFVYRNEENLGCIQARNQGLNRARGKYVLFLDNDQWISSYSTHYLMMVGSDIAGVEAWAMDDKGYASLLKKNPYHSLVYVGAGGMLTRKNTLSDLNGFDEAYSPAWFEDPDICLRARTKGYSIGYSNNHGIEHLAHKTVNTQKTFDSNEAWKKSHTIFMKKWAGNIHPKSIVLFADVVGWAWDIKSRQIMKWLKKDFNLILKYLTVDRVSGVFADLVFTYDCVPKVLGMLNGRKHITGVTAHVYQNFDNWERNLKKANAIHANSKFLFDEICGLNDHCYYLPNGVDEELFQFCERDLNDTFRVGYVGKPGENKGYPNIIIPACEKAGVEFYPIATRHGMKDMIPHVKMPAYYQKVDVILIASTTDGTPNMLLEAASTGRTFIGNKIGNVPELVEEGVNGFMVNREIDDYVDRILFLKKNRDVCSEMGKEARKTVEENWTWKRQVKNYKKMFQDVIYEGV